MRRALFRAVLVLSCLVHVARSAEASRQVVCETTVAVGDGKLVIDLWDSVAPVGAKRLVELV